MPAGSTRNWASAVRSAAEPSTSKPVTANCWWPSAPTRRIEGGWTSIRSGPGIDGRRREQSDRRREPEKGELEALGTCGPRRAHHRVGILSDSIRTRRWGRGQGRSVTRPFDGGGFHTKKLNRIPATVQGTETILEKASRLPGAPKDSGSLSRWSDNLGVGTPRMGVLGFPSRPSRTPGVPPKPIGMPESVGAPSQPSQRVVRTRRKRRRAAPGGPPVVWNPRGPAGLKPATSCGGGRRGPSSPCRKNWWGSRGPPPHRRRPPGPTSPVRGAEPGRGRGSSPRGGRA